MGHAWGSGLASPPASAPGAIAAPELPSGWTGKPIAYSGRDMVVAANPLAVEAGVRVLARGGSAMDAAIAVQMVLTLVEPQSSGIGGGAFLLHYDKASNTLSTYDGRETAPAAVNASHFMTPRGSAMGFFDAVDSGLAVGTPGLVRMLEMAHRRHGRLAWSALFDDGIRLSEAGFPISARLHAQVAGTAARIKAQGEPVASYFLNPDGSAKAAGTVQRNPELAGTLRQIASGGADALYTGAIAEAIVEKVRQHPTRPGLLTRSDLASYKARARAAVCGNYRAYRVCGMAPPSSGAITVLQTLGMLSHFDVPALKPGSADAVHLMSEAYRLAYADRDRYIADDDFIAVPRAGLLDPGYLAARARLIRMDRSMGMPNAGSPTGAVALGSDTSLSMPSTSHLSIVDGEGNVVSMTTTIENGFGSLQMVRGFLLNNQLTDFSFMPTDSAGQPIANAVAPGKRPRSSMAPTVVFNAQGEVAAIVGSPGGANIIQYVVKTLVGLIDWDLNIQQAIDLPNFGARAGPGTWLERATPLTALQTELESRGHAVFITDMNSGLHGITAAGFRGGGPAKTGVNEPGVRRWAGGADPRREGVAKGND